MPSRSDAPLAREPSSAGAALFEAKRAMRAQRMAARDGLDPAFRAQASQAIVERLWALPALSAAGVLLVTLPFRSEWDSMPLVRRALAQRRCVAVPRVDAAARVLTLHAIADPDADIVRGGMGVPEPRASCPAVDPSAVDAVVVPGVAFDPSGGRLGYGGGYYDRLLPLLRPGVPRIAAAFDEQVVELVPCGPRDERVDVVVTPTRTLRAVR
jgi:5-formyltetrahydrofolate cyclo-ligase